MSVVVRPSGPLTAKIMLVGEAPGFDEELKGEPFVGASGQLLNQMLAEVGILRSDCFISNVCRIRPPGNKIEAFMAKSKKQITKEMVQLRGKWVLPVVKEGADLLWREIQMVKPNVVVAIGNLAMYTLTGKWGITKQRGSMLRADMAGHQPKVIPIIHPASILRQWEQRSYTVVDLRRVAAHQHTIEYPKTAFRFVLRPSFEGAVATLAALLNRLNSGEAMRLSFDLETRRGHISCAGIAWTLQDAICIPFMIYGTTDGYWTEEQEAYLVWMLYQILTHKDAKVIGQNLLYDAQYTYRHWHFVPNVSQDTMTSHHVCFAALPKRLDFQASIYCENYSQWKPDKDTWKEGG